MYICYIYIYIYIYIHPRADIVKQTLFKVLIKVTLIQSQRLYCRLSTMFGQVTCLKFKNIRYKQT